MWYTVVYSSMRRNHTVKGFSKLLFFGFLQLLNTLSRLWGSVASKEYVLTFVVLFSLSDGCCMVMLIGVGAFGSQSNPGSIGSISHSTCQVLNHFFVSGIRYHK